MKRKRFIKKLMAMGLSRNEAAAEAKRARSKLRSYTEHFRRIEAGISTIMGVRRLSRAFAATGIQTARAADAFLCLATVMANSADEVVSWGKGVRS